LVKAAQQILTLQDNPAQRLNNIHNKEPSAHQVLPLETLQVVHLDNSNLEVHSVDNKLDLADNKPPQIHSADKLEA
jgi:hypothetical protein